jgi:hypothetical protein
LLLLLRVINNLSELTMPNLRSKDNKRKSDTVIVENAKAQKLAKGAENKRIVQVPITTQLKVLKEAHEELMKVNKENVKEIEDLSCSTCP